MAKLRRLVALALLLLGGAYVLLERGREGAPAAVVEPRSADAALAEAFEKRRSDVWAQGSGTVARVLPDDERGSRHQRFILELSSGQTLLVAHNIDIAPRLPDLEPGDEVAFLGEYEWNAQGGVIHWTHRDPDGRHAGGWIRHDGEVYR